MRDGDKRIVRLKEGSPRGRHVVIVDDLVQSGGTLSECQKLLKSQVSRLATTAQKLQAQRSAAGPRLMHPPVQGAKAVSAYATHGVFPSRSWERFTKANGTEDGFEFFWITDSCARTVSDIGVQRPFEVLSLAGPISAALLI